LGKPPAKDIISGEAAAESIVAVKLALEVGLGYDFRHFQIIVGLTPFF